MSADTLITIAATLLAVGLVLALARKIGKLAERRGRRFYLWTFFGFVQPVTAVILLFCLPNRASPDLSHAAKHF